MLETLFPFLQNRLSTIYNAVDLKAFSSDTNRIKDDQNRLCERFRIVVAASYQQKKNMANLAKALVIVKRTYGSSFRVDWYGGMPKDQSAYKETCRFINEHGLSQELSLHPPTRTILNEYLNSSAVGLFSFFEGLPNVVCEGMACGKPILLSNVCDAENLVQEGRNGFLCDPASPESIAKAIEKMLHLSPDERRRMGAESRKMAEQLFSPDPIIERYESLLERASKGSAASSMCSWPSHVPGSAMKTVAACCPEFKPGE